MGSYLPCRSAIGLTAFCSSPCSSRFLTARHFPERHVKAIMFYRIIIKFQVPAVLCHFLLPYSIYDVLQFADHRIPLLRQIGGDRVKV